MEARGPEEDDSVRFEDLTVDDDLPIIERIVRYTGSQIALQRLVHVKMLAETAELAGYVFVNVRCTALCAVRLSGASSSVMCMKDIGSL